MTNSPQSPDTTAIADVEKLLKEYTFTSSNGQIVFYNDHINSIERFKAKLATITEEATKSLLARVQKEVIGEDEKLTIIHRGQILPENRDDVHKQTRNYLRDKQRTQLNKLRETL